MSDCSPVRHRLRISWKGGHHHIPSAKPDASTSPGDANHHPNLGLSPALFPDTVWLFVMLWWSLKKNPPGVAFAAVGSGMSQTAPCSDPSLHLCVQSLFLCAVDELKYALT